MSTKTENKMTSFKQDLLSAVIIGTVAGLLSPVVANNLNLKISWIYLFAGFLAFCVIGILIGRFIGKYVPVLYKLAKFGETGGLNWILDLGVVNVLILLTGISSGIYYGLFKAISFTVAVINSYFWNKFWVFKGAVKQKESVEITKFITASVLGIIFNVSLASLIVFVGPNVISSVNSVTWANLGVIAGSLGAMLFNFVLYKIWVFKN